MTDFTIRGKVEKVKRDTNAKIYNALHKIEVPHVISEASRLVKEERNSTRNYSS